MNKGKVIDIQKKYAVVMNDQMAYEKIEKKKGLTVGKEIYYFEEDRYEEIKYPVKKYFLVAAVLFMMILFIQPLFVGEEAYGYISIDINPSIQLEVNRELMVLAVEGINNDGKMIIKDEWINKNAKDVIDLIILEIKNKGFLNAERDFVLLSYFFNDEDDASEKSFVKSLDQLFNEKPHDYEVALIKSDLETYSESKKVKKSLGQITVNKKMNTKVDDLLSLRESMEKDEAFKIYKKDLYNDDIEEEQEDKKIVKNKKDNNNENIKKIMTRVEIKAIVQSLLNGAIVEVNLNQKNNKALYVIKVHQDQEIHEIIIDAFTGEIINHTVEEDSNNNELNEVKENDDEEKKEKEDKDKENEEKGSNNQSGGIIGRKAAKKNALESLGDQGKIIDFDFDRDDGEAEYEFEVMADGKIHKIIINAFTGEVTSHDVEDELSNKNEADEKNKKNELNDKSKGVIGRKTALKIAFDAIGDNGKIIDFDFDRDDDEAEYEFEIEIQGKIHEIIINALTGEIIDYEIKYINDED